MAHAAGLTKVWQSLWDRYETLEVLGQGTYGLVYKAVCKSTGALVALKRCRLDIFRDFGIPETTLREVTLLRDLMHRNIVTLHYISCNLDRLYMVCELLDMDLKKFIKIAGGSLPIAQVKHIAYEVFRGISYCHGMRVLHRDLKPHNILISEDLSKIKLADFGLARAAAMPGKTLTHEVITLWYRAPELLLGHCEYDDSVDVWSAGCVLAELLSGKPLFPGDSEIDTLFRIFRLLGKPAEADWPSSAVVKWKCVPNFSGKLRPFSSGLRAELPPMCEDLLDRIFKYDPRKRICALDVLRHPWFADIHEAESRSPEVELFSAPSLAEFGCNSSFSGGPTLLPKSPVGRESNKRGPHGKLPTPADSSEHHKKREERSSNKHVLPRRAERAIADPKGSDHGLLFHREQQREGSICSGAQKDLNRTASEIRGVSAYDVSQKKQPQQTGLVTERECLDSLETGRNVIGSSKKMALNEVTLPGEGEGALARGADFGLELPPSLRDTTSNRPSINNKDSHKHSKVDRTALTCKSGTATPQSSLALQDRRMSAPAIGQGIRDGRFSKSISLIKSNNSCASLYNQSKPQQQSLRSICSTRMSLGSQACARSNANSTSQEISANLKQSSVGSMMTRTGSAVTSQAMTSPSTSLKDINRRCLTEPPVRESQQEKERLSARGLTKDTVKTQDHGLTKKRRSSGPGDAMEEVAYRREVREATAETGGRRRKDQTMPTVQKTTLIGRSGACRNQALTFRQESTRVDRISTRIAGTQSVQGLPTTTSNSQEWGAVASSRSKDLVSQETRRETRKSREGAGRLTKSGKKGTTREVTLSCISSGLKDVAENQRSGKETGGGTQSLLLFFGKGTMRERTEEAAAALGEVEEQSTGCAAGDLGLMAETSGGETLEQLRSQRKNTLASFLKSDSHESMIRRDPTKKTNPSTRFQRDARKLAETATARARLGSEIVEKLRTTRASGAAAWSAAASFAERKEEIKNTSLCDSGLPRERVRLTEHITSSSGGSEASSESAQCIRTRNLNRNEGGHGISTPFSCESTGKSDRAGSRMSTPLNIDEAGRCEALPAPAERALESLSLKSTNEFETQSTQSAALHLDGEDGGRVRMAQQARPRSLKERPRKNCQKTGFGVTLMDEAGLSTKIERGARTKGSPEESKVCGGPRSCFLRRRQGGRLNLPATRTGGAGGLSERVNNPSSSRRAALVLRDVRRNLRAAWKGASELHSGKALGQPLGRSSEPVARNTATERRAKDEEMSLREVVEPMTLDVGDYEVAEDDKGVTRVAKTSDAESREGTKDGLMVLLDQYGLKERENGDVPQSDALEELSQRSLRRSSRYQAQFVLERSQVGCAADDVAKKQKESSQQQDQQQNQQCHQQVPQQHNQQQQCKRLSAASTATSLNDSLLSTASAPGEGDAHMVDMVELTEGAFIGRLQGGTAQHLGATCATVTVTTSSPFVLEQGFGEGKLSAADEVSRGPMDLVLRHHQERVVSRSWRDTSSAEPSFLDAEMTSSTYAPAKHHKGAAGSLERRHVTDRYLCKSESWNKLTDQRDRDRDRDRENLTASTTTANFSVKVDHQVCDNCHIECYREMDGGKGYVGTGGIPAASNWREKVDIKERAGRKMEDSDSFCSKVLINANHARKPLAAPHSEPTDLLSALQRNDNCLRHGFSRSDASDLNRTAPWDSGKVESIFRGSVMEGMGANGTPECRLGEHARPQAAHVMSGNAALESQLGFAEPDRSLLERHLLDNKRKRPTRTRQKAGETYSSENSKSAAERVKERSKGTRDDALRQQCRLFALERECCRKGAERKDNFFHYASQRRAGTGTGMVFDDVAGGGPLKRSATEHQAR